ncbi:MAG: PucR family transcriptional regulator [Frankiales bacterium]|nr:PucR family transcriptional regulator [Frankiales bacterium]
MTTPPQPVTLLAKRVLADLDTVTDQLVGAILSADPSYGGDRTTTDDLRRSCHANLARIIQALTGEPAAGDAFDAPHTTGHRRAEQGMPLESVLHAYRLGHRIIWDALVAQARDDDAVDGLVEAASYVWELVDSYSSEVARAYRETEQLLLRRDDRRRDALMEALLEGRGHDRPLLAEAAATLDLPEHGPYAVVVLSGTEGWRQLRDALAVRGLRSAWRERADTEVGVVSLARTPWTELLQVLQHPGLRGGLSPSVDGLAAVDSAHRLAQVALRTAAHGVVALDDRLPAALVVSAPELSERLVTKALGGVLALDPEERDSLLETLAVWIDTGGSAGQSAARLYCHRNTVLNRLRRIEALTGRSSEHIDDLVTWSLALLARDLLAPSAPSESASPRLEG